MVSPASPSLTLGPGSHLAGYETPLPPKPLFVTLTVTQFHVDKLSSAHIYLRLRDGETWDNIPEELLTDLAQLTKANSIEGRFLTPGLSRLPFPDNPRQQKGQHHHHLHPLVQPQEGRQHGRRPGQLQGQ